MHSRDLYPFLEQQLKRIRCKGYTLFELILAVAIAGLLLGISIPVYQDIVQDRKIDQAVWDMMKLELRIQRYHTEHGSYPNSLSDLGDVPPDPWGNPYQYLNIRNAKKKGKVRKDHSLVPLNDDYDLYSMGEDGRSAPPLTAKMSRDDVVRASNGGYIGLATGY